MKFFLYMPLIKLSNNDKSSKSIEESSKTEKHLILTLQIDVCVVGFRTLETSRETYYTETKKNISFILIIHPDKFYENLYSIGCSIARELLKNHDILEYIQKNTYIESWKGKIEDIFKVEETYRQYEHFKNSVSITKSEIVTNSPYYTGLIVEYTYSNPNLSPSPSPNKRKHEHINEKEEED